MRPLLAVFVVLVGLSGCANAPPIGTRLPRNFAQANAAFDQRVKTRFPVGSPEGNLLAELKREHFKISPAYDRSGRFSNDAKRGGNMGPTCNLQWEILWSSADAKIAEIAATYYATCL